LNVSSPSEQGLSLNKGEILKGSVQSIKDGGLITLYLKGKLTEAVSQIPFKTGEEVFLQVDSFKDGQVYLKVLTPMELQQAQDINLASNLIEIGITPGKDNILMVRELLDHNLPVSRENLNFLSRAAVILGGVDEKNLQSAAFCLSKGIELEQQSLLAVRQLLFPEGSLAKLVDSLLSYVNSLARQAVSTAEITVSSEKALEVSQQQVSSSGEKLLPADVKPAEVPANERRIIFAKVNSLAAKQSVQTGDNKNTQVAQPSQTESALRTASDTTSVQGSWSGLTADTAIQGNRAGVTADKVNTPLPLAFIPVDRQEVSSNFLRQIPFLRELLQAIILNMSGESQKTAQKLQNMMYSEKDILRGLMLFEEMIRNETERTKNPVISELLNKLEVVERELGGQKIFNFTTRGQADNSVNCYYFSFPVQIDNEQHLCELRLNKDYGKNSLQNQENINFIVSLETGGMGMVLFHVNWHRAGRIELQGVVEKAPVKKHLDDNLSGLLNALEKLGYEISNLGIKVAQNSEETGSLKKDLLNKKERITAFAVDIRI